jgi:hypothetical protein
MGLVASSLPILDRFRVIRPLGEGGMGKVFEAEDLQSGARVALKMLSSLTPDSIRRFKAEFRALRDLHHPNLVRLGELLEQSGNWFFTMEVVDGVELLEFVRQGRTAGFAERELRAVLGQLADGLTALHDAGKVHRDVKPSNIRVGPDGRVVLLDFGLVTDADPKHQSSRRSILGTAAYMAPEQGSAQPLGPAADWYAVGVILYEALTGALPFDGHILEVILQKQQSEPPAPRTRAAAIPGDLNDLCVCLLRREPGARANGAEILRVVGRPVAAAKREPAAAGSMFVGRQRELDELARALADTLCGEPTVVVVEGESGVGKSALVRRFRDSLEERRDDALILTGRCYERESVPYKGFDSLMDALAQHLRHLDQVDAAFLLPEDTALLARVFPVLHRVPAARRFVPDADSGEAIGPELRTKAFAALRELFRRIGERATLVVSIDDFQWADDDSLALLREIVSGEHAPRMLLVVAMRAQDPQRLAPALAALDAVHRLRRLPLTGLAPAESAELALRLCDRYAARGADAESLAQQANGHPFFLGELVRYAAHQQAPHAPVRIEDALTHRVGQLDPLARRLLATVVAAGAPLATAIAAAAARLSPELAAASLGTLRAAMFVRSGAGDTIEPYHDRVREVVYGLMPEEERREVHASLAEAFEDAEPAHRDPHALVRHLLAARRTERAARTAIEAAGLAVKTLAFERAAELFQVALSVGSQRDAERLDLMIQRARALASAGRSLDAADAYLAGAEIAPTRAKQLELRRLAAQHFLFSGHLERALSEMRAILDDIGLTLPATPRAVVASLVWNRLRLRVRGLEWRSRDVSEIPPQVLESLEVHKALAVGLALTDSVRGVLCGAKSLRLALDVGERGAVARGLAQVACNRATLGGPKARAQIAPLFAQAREIAASMGDAYLTGFAAGCSGIASFLMGDFRRAVDELDESERTLRPIPGVTFELCNVRVVRMVALRHMGLMRQVASEHDLYVRDARQRKDRFTETTIIRAASLTWLARGMPERAVEELGRSSWPPLDENGLVHVQHHYDLRAEAEHALYVGRGHEVRPRQRRGIDILARSLLMRVQILRCDFTWYRARCALAELLVRPDAQLRREVLGFARRLRAEGVGYAATWAELVTAGVRAADGDRDAAAAALRNTMELGERHDVLIGRAAAERRLGEVVGGMLGTEMIARADTWMRAQGIVSPEAMTDVIAPGFRS